MADAFTPGSVWGAKSSFVAVEEIRIVSETENRRIILVESIRDGRQYRMRADIIRHNYAPSEGTGHGTPVRRYVEAESDPSS